MIELILTIAILGFIVFMILQIPMPQVFKTLIVGLVIIAVVLWLVHNLGYLPHLKLKL